MKTLLIIVNILIFSCTNKSRTSTDNATLLDSIYKIEGFDTAIRYSDPICLQYKERPLLVIGQNINQLDTTLSFRYDPNGKYQDYYGTITDYLSLDENYSAYLSKGSIVGALYFSADNKGRIFKLEGNWKINAYMLDTSGMEIMAHFQNRYFPCLPYYFKSKGKFEFKHRNFTEKFNLYPQPDTVDGKYIDPERWNLDYTIELKSKGSL
jgi:hypothetical protein